MRYCARCLYPENAKPTIIIDDQDGICSGCKYHESRSKTEIDWSQRKEIFVQLLDQAKTLSKSRGNLYDCIVPVSGGKDSHFQVWTLKKYGMNPLLVTYNHIYNTQAGLRNLENLVEKSGCDLIRFTASPHSVQKVSRFMLKEVGDLTWHYHAGIRTLPFRIAVEKNIPLIVWGEHGFAELTGIVSLEDFVEFTKWTRKEHDMRGYEPENVVSASAGQVSMTDLYPYIYPTDDEIEKTDVRGIYMSNFFPWNAKEHAELMMKEWDFSPITFERDRTFLLYAKIEDHANDVHDYLKYLKFGYGRATDDASMEIRHGRMTREEGIEMVEYYDHREPKTLDSYCDFLKISKAEFYKLIDNMRDLDIWEYTSGKWVPKDSVVNHKSSALIEKARIPQSKDRVFSEMNRGLYYNRSNPPLLKNDWRVDQFQTAFKIL